MPASSSPAGLVPWAPREQTKDWGFSVDKRAAQEQMRVPTAVSGRAWTPNHLQTQGEERPRESGQRSREGHRDIDRRGETQRKTESQRETERERKKTRPGPQIPCPPSLVSPQAAAVKFFISPSWSSRWLFSYIFCDNLKLDAQAQGQCVHPVDGSVCVLGGQMAFPHPLPPIHSPSCKILGLWTQPGPLQPAPGPCCPQRCPPQAL